jgi:hypothetical protein
VRKYFFNGVDACISEANLPTVTGNRCSTDCPANQIPNIVAKDRTRPCKDQSAGNDISPRWANTDAKINSVSPGNGAPSDSNVRISETANTP